MTESEMQEKAFETVRNSANATLSNLQVRAKVKNFLDGTLFFIYFQNTQNSREYQNYVYLKGNDAIILKSSEELAKLMSVYSPQRGSHKLLRDMFSVGAIAGLIAIIVTITICYLVVVKGVEKPPEILATALTSILGFYFGSQVARKDH